VKDRAVPQRWSGIIAALDDRALANDFPLARALTLRNHPPAGCDRAQGKSQMKLGYGIKPWTPEEEERLRLLISERLRPHEIAVKLHRTVEAVYRRAQKLRLSFRRPPPRS
jgi:hypothetical protein